MRMNGSVEGHKEEQMAVAVVGREEGEADTE